MARVKLDVPFAEIHGTIEKYGIISRQKKYYDENGKVIHEGRQEAYAVRHPRDFDKTPPQGKELANMNLWREACLRTSQILKAETISNNLNQPQSSPPSITQSSNQTHPKEQNQAFFYTPEEALTLILDFRRRFKAQLPSVRGTHPDPEAPIDRTTRLPKRYHHFPSFIRTIIYNQLKQPTQQ